jgi:hypothetical protein
MPSPRIYDLAGFDRWRLPRRTPAPPPSASMISTLANSNARLKHSKSRLEEHCGDYLRL